MPRAATGTQGKQLSENVCVDSEISFVFVLEVSSVNFCPASADGTIVTLLWVT
jgi:hypothetical protein